MAPNGLEAWYDATLQPAPLTPEEVALQEARRLYDLHNMAVAAATIPRRLGGEAIGRELAQDKRLCRRVAHAASVLCRLWLRAMTVHPPRTLDSKAAAQVVWSDWWADHQDELQRKLAWVATWGIEHDQRSRANQFVSLLEREQAEFARIFDE